VSLADDSPRPYHLSALAARVSGSTDVIEPTKRRGQIFGLGQGALTGRLPCPINVEDHPGVSRTIYQPAGLLVGREWPIEQIIKEQAAQGFHGDWRQRGSQTAKGPNGKAVGRVLAPAINGTANG
jgi:hypothetical protein